MLDNFLESVPPGVAGELYLAGAALARGYAGHPEWTAERFVATAGGARMYRTGDLVMWKNTGSGHRLHYLGRNDAQLKVNGVRIEPAEIEAAVAAITGRRLLRNGSPHQHRRHSDAGDVRAPETWCAA